jgi:hypothetical protein
MKNNILFFFVIVSIFTILSLFSCTERNIPDNIEIPFVIENNRIVIEAIINGKKGRFCFDTGSTESYLDISSKNLLSTSYTTTIYQGKPKNVLIYHLNRIRFGETELKTSSWVITRSDSVINAKKNGYNGVLGNRIFEGYWRELSFSKNKIILYKKKPEHYKNHLPVKIESKYDADFYIPSIIDEEKYYFNIDTGLFHGIYFPPGIVKTKRPDEYREILSREEVGQYYLVRTKLIKIFDEVYADTMVMTNSYIAHRRKNNQAYNDRGILGLEFLKYYDFLFDYRDLRHGKTTGIYYAPNTPMKERDYGFYSFLKEIPQFGVIDFSVFESGIGIISVINDSIAYTRFGLRPGTVITKINGKPIGDYSGDELLDPFSYQTVENYTILQNDNERTIELFSKEDKQN